MRNMRQVIKTNQNFVTGEHYEQRVLKPIQAARNRVTVQLCDAASGKIVEEAVTENAISSVLESAAYGTIGNILNDGSLMGYVTPPSFSSIVLSDSSLAELQDPYFIHGNVIGMCNRTDSGGSGSSKYRGTYNSLESYTKIEDDYTLHTHLVYDWPTSAGNGKIQQISWLASAITYGYGQERAVGCFRTISRSPVGKASNYTFDRRGNMYQYTSGKYYKVLNMLPFINGLEDPKVEATESFMTPYEVNNHYYKFISQFANPPTPTFTLKIEKYDTAGSLVDAWEEDLIAPVPQLVQLKNNSQIGGGTAGNPSITAVDYCDFDGWVGFRINYASNTLSPSGRVFPTRNSAGELVPNSSHSVLTYSFYNVLTKQWLRTANPWDIWCTYTNYTESKVLRKIDNKHICSNGYHTIISANDITAEGYASNWEVPGETYQSRNMTGIHASLPLATSSYDNAFKALNPIMAQTLLAAPITKTSLNTMKIQYDFFFKIPLPYMTPDHVWDLYK